MLDRESFIDNLIEGSNPPSVEALCEANQVSPNESLNTAPLEIARRFDRAPEWNAMATYTLTVEENPKSEDVEVLSHELTAHALPYTHVPGFQPLGVFLRDEQGILLGGVWGHVNWNWLSVGLVWLSEALRGGGYGRQLMTAFEQAARERGCQYAHLDTFSWQARPFYEGLGYEVFAILDAYPPGQQRFFMKKTLL